MTATARSTTAIRIDGTAALFIAHLVSSVIYHADRDKGKCDLHGGRRQVLVEWEGQNQPEIELKDASVRCGVRLFRWRIQFDREDCDRNLSSQLGVIVRRVGYPCGRPDSRLGTTGFRRYASGGVYALYARDFAERTLRADRLCN
jgi:hypothetical protein